MLAMPPGPLEREAGRLGALAAPGDVAIAADLERSWSARSSRSAASTCSSSTRVARRARARRRHRRAGRERRRAPALRGPARPPLPSPPGGERPRPRDRDHLDLGEGADRQPRASRARPTGADGLAEDPLARARLKGDGQRRRSRPDRHRAGAARSIPTAQRSRSRRDPAWPARARAGVGDVVCFLASDRPPT